VFAPTSHELVRDPDPVYAANTPDESSGSVLRNQPGIGTSRLKKNKNDNFFEVFYAVFEAPNFRAMERFADSTVMWGGAVQPCLVDLYVLLMQTIK
jgi:hypothetical protein